ncbi:hypothetical protein GCM10009617_31160 [Leifsonia poae]|uniref:Uncharacterized protein n=2 Tax=Leifsonia poae TaxID=110933 RepID=A0A9W6H9C2_9MICO|nr:hypothetical protein GCM10017584_18700 [Leifsonia poae]
MEHGWIARVTRSEQAEPRHRRFTLSDWLPAAIQARGGRVTRDDERAFRDLQGVLDAREAGR